MNLPFCVATLLIESDVFVDQFSEPAITDPQRMMLAEKVAVRHDPAITARGARFRHMVRVEVHLTDGTRYEEIVEAPRGSEQKFASESDIVAKFTKLTRRVLPDATTERICASVLGCDKLPDIGVLVDALAQKR